MTIPSYRQSLLRTFDACPLAAKWDHEAPDWSSPEQALGTVFHAVAEELLRTLRGAPGDAVRGPLTRIPTEEALVIADEVQARPDVPHLAHEQRRVLRIMVLQFCKHEWTASRIIGLEEPLQADIACPDGNTRRLTGRPDVLIADPPGGLIIIDFKSGWAKPPEPRDGNWLREDGRPYLSERGVFQLDSYGYLAMRTMPAVERVTLREFHARRDVLREAYLRREDLEHVEKYLALALQRADETMTGAREPEPRPGAWCSRACPAPARCPVPAALRGAGSITTDDDAYDVARRFAVTNATRGRDVDALKAWLDTSGQQAIRTGDGWVGWQETARSRRFGVHAADPNLAVTEGDPA